MTTYHCVRTLAGIAGVTALSALTLPLASALPPGGASSNTPGTSSSVSPAEVAQCGTLNFEISGFPAGETVNVKIDDGAGYSDQSIQFTGVVATQKLDSSGHASGTVSIPCDLAEGQHTLRFLASEVNTGTGGGSKGFSNKSPSFTVVAQTDEESTTTTTAANSTTNNNSDTSNASGNSTSQGRTAAASGGGAAATVVEEVIESGSDTTNNSATTSNGTTADGKAINADGLFGSNTSTTGSSGTTNTGVATETAYIAQAASTNRVPWIGIFVGGAILLVGMTAINVWVFLQRRDK